MDVGGRQVWGSGFGRWARPVPTYVLYIYIYTVTALLELDQRPYHLGNMDLKSCLAMNQSDSIAVVLFFSHQNSLFVISTALLFVKVS